MGNSSVKIFLILVIAFILNQLIAFIGITITFFHSYLDDLLCFPIILSILLFIHRKWRLENNFFILPVSHIILSLLMFIVIFELLLPIISSKFTGDIFDVLAYVIGVLFFFKYINVVPKSLLTTTIPSVKFLAGYRRC